jgi:hypothetical protein
MANVALALSIFLYQQIENANSAMSGNLNEMHGLDMLAT